MVIPKVILDTNLFIAAYFNPLSHSAEILNLAQTEKIDVLWTDKIKKEINFILNNIKARDSFREKINKILKTKNKVTKAPKLEVVKEDIEDNKLIECAFKGRAKFIITNDYHLLRLRNYKKTKIIRPSAFIKIFYGSRHG